MATATTRRIPTSQIVVPIVLGIILVPLAQIALWYLGGSEGVTLIWLVGTPICYFLTGGLTALTTVRGFIPALARGRGARVGFIAGTCGACSSALIAAAFAVWYIATPTQPTSLAHPQSSVMPHAAMMGPVFPPIVVVLFVLLPLFLGANLFGIGLAPLGGMLGGYLRARVSPHRIALPEQAGDQVVAPSWRGILVIIGVALLMAIIVAAGILMFNIIALAPHNTGVFPATIG